MTKIWSLHSQNAKQVTSILSPKFFCALVDDEKVSIQFQSQRRLTVIRRWGRTWDMWPKTLLDLLQSKVHNLVHKEDSWWQLHRAEDPLLYQELCHEALNIARFCLQLNISLAYSCLRLVPLINFPGSSVAGVGEPKNTEFVQLLLGGEAVAITSQADGSSKWCCQLYKLEQSFRFHLPLLSRTANEDCSGPWYIMCCL